MNALILSAGTRNMLVRYFMDRENGFDKVIATDCSDFAPAIYAVDRWYKVPRITEPDYLEAIADICKKENIHVIIPLQEDELIRIARDRDRFESMGILVALSDYDKVVLCRDKFALNSKLLNLGISSVATYLAKDIECIPAGDIVVKPRLGAGSMETFIAHDKNTAASLVAATATEMVLQPFMHGKEYGVDLYVDFISGDVIAVFIKEKIRMRAGETEKSISVINNDIKKLAVAAAQGLALRGCLDMDITEENGQYYILEINPRFGGGYPHAYLCGVNFIKMLAANADGVANQPLRAAYKENVRAMKYSDIMLK